MVGDRRTTAIAAYGRQSAVGRIRRRALVQLLAHVSDDEALVQLLAHVFGQLVFAGLDAVEEVLPRGHAEVQLGTVRVLAVADRDEALAPALVGRVGHRAPLFWVRIRRWDGLRRP